MKEFANLLERLSDWRMAGPGGFREIGAGVVESYGGPGLLWYPAGEFADFVLHVEWRTQDLTDNSGVFVRVPALRDDPQPAIDQGYEVQIDDRGVDPERGVLGSPLHLTGAIYKQAGAAFLASRAVGQWNTFKITAMGQRISVLLNDSEVALLQGARRSASGHIGLQNHHEGSAVQFANLSVIALSTL